MHSVIITSSTPPWDHDGVARMVNEISSRLTDYFDIQIFSIDDYSYSRIFNGIPVRVFKRVTSFREISHDFSPELYRCLKNVKCDLFHCYNFSNFVPFITALAKGNRKIVFSTIFHPIASRKLDSVFRKFYEPTFGYYALKRADLITCFSNTEKTLLLKRYSISPEKTLVIYNGVDLHRIWKAEPYDLETKIILYVGRLVRYKNVHLVIESLSFLPDEYRLIIIGKGNYEYELKRNASKLGVRERIEFLGNLPDELMYRWLKTCSIQLQLSRYESGVSLSSIEGLAAGKPAIVNDRIEALKETVDLFGGKGVFPFNAEVNSPKELAELIQETSDAEVSADLRAFDWDITAERFKDAYFRLLE